MNDYRTVLKRVGIALIVVGVLDIVYMAYCIFHNQSYSSSFNIFAVIAGVFLIRGSLRAVRIVTWFSALMVAGFLGVALLLFPFIQPLDLWATEYRVNPLGTILMFLVGAAVIALLLWVYQQLRSPSVMQARVAAGQKVAPPRAAFSLGILLVVILAAIMHFTMRGETAA